MTPRRELIATVHRLTQAGFDRHEIEQLLRQSRRLSGLDLRYANGEGWTPNWIENAPANKWDDDDQLKYDKLTTAALDIVNAICNARSGRELCGPPLRAYHQSDPRGCALWLVDATHDDGHHSDYTNAIAVTA